MGFRPEESIWTRCVPTWNDTETDFPVNVLFRSVIVYFKVR